MEITCSRCHQAVQPDCCYCPTCGLPQLVFQTDDTSGTYSSERWTEAARDAGSVDWRNALKPAMLLGIPAGLLSSDRSPVSFLCLFWMAGAAAWAVTRYVRHQRPGWITIGAGARIGLVTGLLGGWFAFAGSAVSLFLARFVQGQGKLIDEPLQAMVAQVSQQWQTSNADPQALAAARRFAAWCLTPAGRAGWILLGMVLVLLALLIFATAGGAIGARMMAKKAPAQE